VEPLAQGRVWTGAQAKQNGLVDAIGGIDRAIEMVKQKANIAASEKSRWCLTRAAESFAGADGSRYGLHIDRVARGGFADRG